MQSVPLDTYDNYFFIKNKQKKIQKQQKISILHKISKAT